MAGGLLRVGDANVAGGLIMEGDPTVLVNGRPIAYINAQVSPHQPYKGIHNHARTENKPTGLMVNGRYVITWPSTDTCGHPRITGSSDVIFGG